MKLLTQANKKALPPLYANENKPAGDAVAHVKFFTPWSSWTWYATEFDGTDRFFGRVDGHVSELGYFSLTELQSVKGPMGLKIERDMHWKSRPLKNIPKVVSPVSGLWDALSHSHRVSALYQLGM
jgi:hypothetical protein